VLATPAQKSQVLVHVQTTIYCNYCNCNALRYIFLTLLDMVEICRFQSTSFSEESAASIHRIWDPYTLKMDAAFPFSSVGPYTPASFVSDHSQPWQCAMSQQSLLQQYKSVQHIAYRSTESQTGPWCRLQSTTPVGSIVYSHRICDKKWLLTTTYLVSD
jgi:hypothetical protein